MFQVTDLEPEICDALRESLRETRCSHGSQKMTWGISNVSPTQHITFEIIQKPGTQIMFCFWLEKRKWILFCMLRAPKTDNNGFQVLIVFSVIFLLSKQEARSPGFLCPAAIGESIFKNLSQHWFSPSKKHPQFFVAGPFLTQAGHFGVSAQWSCCWPWFHSWLLPSLLVACPKDQMDCQWPVDIDQDG